MAYESDEQRRPHRSSNCAIPAALERGAGMQNEIILHTRRQRNPNSLPAGFLRHAVRFDAYLRSLITYQQQMNNSYRWDAIAPYLYESLEPPSVEAHKSGIRAVSYLIPVFIDLQKYYLTEPTRFPEQKVVSIGFNCP